MNGELATIQLHLFPTGIYAECERTGSGEFIPIGDMKPLVDFINMVQEMSDPETKYAITEEGLEFLKQLEEDEE